MSSTTNDQAKEPAPIGGNAVAAKSERLRPFRGINEDALELRRKIALNEIHADGPRATKELLELVCRLSDALATREAAK